MATYVVTGANRGIGLEFARVLSEAGHEVIGTARDPDAAGELRRVASAVYPLDISDGESVASFAGDLGETTVDVLINNAAVGLEKTKFASLDFDEVQEQVVVNSVGAMRVTQALLPRLRAGEGKTIACVTSTLGSIGLTGTSMGGGYYAYRAGKAALNMFVRTLADELKGEGFSCFVIHPGWVKTRMGGEDAPMSVEQSVGGMVPVIEGAGPEQNGSFLDFRGRTVKW